MFNAHRKGCSSGNAPTGWLPVFVFVLVAVLMAAIPAGSANADVYAVNTDVRHELLRWGNSATGAGSMAIFRYRADDVNNNPGNLVGSPQKGHITRYGPIATTTYLHLNGTDQAFVASDPITTRADLGFTVEAWVRTSGHDTRDMHVFSNTQAYRGFSLAIDHGRVRATYSVHAPGESGASSSDRHVVETPTNGPTISDGTWHSIAFAVAIVGYTPPGTSTSMQAVRARIYVDHVQITTSLCDGVAPSSPASCYVTLGVGQTPSLWNSAQPPAVGAEPNGSSLSPGYYFAGDVLAVEAFNWQVDHDVLATPVLWDGGKYGDAPSYFDYDPGVAESDGSAAANWANRKWDAPRREAWSDRGHPGDSGDTAAYTAAIDATSAAMKARVGLPLLNDHYTPQGITLTPDGRTMYLLYYYEKDKDLPSGQYVGNPPNSHCGDEPCPDILVQADLTTMTVSSIYELYTPDGSPFGLQNPSSPNPTYHANGIAIVNGVLYTTLSLGPDASDNGYVHGTLYLFDPGPSGNRQQLASASAQDRRPAIYSLTAQPTTYDVRSSGSALSYSAQTNSLYLMGDYQPEQGDPMHDGDIVRYQLNSAGEPTSSIPNDEYLLPNSTYAAYNQGLAWIGHNTSGDDCFVLSRSEQRSYVPPSTTAPIEDIDDWRSQLTHWCAGEANITVQRTFQFGGENISYVPDSAAGRIWVLTENSAHAMQKRTASRQWYPDFSPYAFSLAADQSGV